jgi:hypothetical protein
VTALELGINQNIPAEVYHAAAGVSNSDLKLFAESPAHYYAAKVLKMPEDDSYLSDDERESRMMGTLLHLAVLEPLKFGRERSHVVKPLTYPDSKTGEAKKWNGNATFCKEWMEEQASKGIPVLSEKEEKRIAGARDAIRSHPVAGQLVKARKSVEASVCAFHPETGLRLRCRPDLLTEDAHGRPWIVDIKSCPSVKRFAYSARDFRYDVQSVFYPDVLAIAGVPNAAFCFIAVELKPRYGIHAVRVVMPDEETQAEARKTYQVELLRFAECQKTDTWPLNNQEIDWIKVRRFAS